VEYSLTEAGKTLLPMLDDLRDWAVRYRPELYRSLV
jgi:DNA-binding HxlR family transcriptional regulator